MARIKNSISNIMSSYFVFFIKTILTFIVRSVLIERIAQTYIGLNSLFTNILSILSIAELGLTNVIGFSLYKPLKEKDNNKISELMYFYKKTYSKIGIIIFMLGILLVPILPFIVKKKIVDMYLIYIMFLINTCSLYFISYKDILISADQKAYKLTLINTLFTIFIGVGELFILYFTSNFIGYLLIQFMLNILQRIVTNRFVSNEYKSIDFNCKKDLDDASKNDIRKNIKAMFFHKIGDSMINATDNIILSAFVSIDMVSIYSNYLLVISYLTTFANMLYNGFLASLGNFIITESAERKYEIFRKTNFLGFTIFSFSSVVLFNVFNVFVEILANKNYLLPNYIVAIIILNFYIAGMRITTGNIKNAAGLFDIDKYTPIIQSVINIVVSIVLAHFYGIAGVLIGTFISGVLPSVQRPCIVYKHILNKPVMEYFLEYGKYFFITIFISIISYVINSAIVIENPILVLVERLAVTTVIYSVIYYFIFKSNKEFEYYKNLIIKFLRREVNG